MKCVDRVGWYSVLVGLGIYLIEGQVVYSRDVLSDEW